MTECLTIPLQSGRPQYYQRSASLKGSASATSLFFDKGVSCSTSPRTACTPHAEHHETLPQSSGWSCPLPADSTTGSFSTNLNTASEDSVTNSSDSSVTSETSDDTDITFPNYDGYDEDFGPSSDSIPQNDKPNDELSESISNTTISESPVSTPTVVDDTAIRQEPSRQVDFLSHEWREEDIWSSWRNIVSQRKTVYGERSRLENASWRTWAKTKFDLRTVSPERLNWLKESDVTWLYGPLKVATSYPITHRTGSHSATYLSKNNSFINKKPILKKRSMSEVMLQKSLSTSSLVKQAAASVQSQGRRWRRNGPDAIDSKLQSETPSRDQIDYFTSRNTSSISTPYESHEKRHIRFDDRVEQCIAIDCKYASLDEDDDGSDGGDAHSDHAVDDSSSDEGLVMMKRKKRATAKRRPTGSRSNSASGRKIIETLPATTLKYRTDSPDITEDAQHHTFGRSWSTGNLSPSPSQETLRPTNPLNNFLLPSDDEPDQEEIDSDSSWSFGASNPKSSLGSAAGSFSSEDEVDKRRKRRDTAATPKQFNFEVEGMRRTPSGMFMPIEGEDEDDVVTAGLFGRVSETINTARDIAHVIWNVGWRK